MDDEDLMTSRRESIAYAIGAGVLALVFLGAAIWQVATVLNRMFKPDVSDWVVPGICALVAIVAGCFCAMFIENAKKCPRARDRP